MPNVAIILYFLLLTVAFLAPLRWSLVGYLMLSAVDFDSGNSGIGILNAVKGIGYPIVLFWRLRQYAGHGKVGVAPIAWMLLVVYAGVASLWSIFPLSAVKLVVELAASFLICLAFLRASKAGYLTPSSILIPATVGVLAVGVLRAIVSPRMGDPQTRFSGFTPPQSYAALLAALFALSLGAKSKGPFIRWVLCITLFIAVVANGSRTWTMGLILGAFLALLLSNTRTWMKVFGAASIILVTVALVAEKETLIQFMARSARTNRVADTITAVYEGNSRSTGLGTYLARRNVYQRTLDALAASSVAELAFGHGTSNGRILRGPLSEGIGDPNRAVHDEWLRTFYEWGIVGSIIWLVFLGSVVVFAYQGMRKDPNDYSKPLLIYFPALIGGLSTENIVAGAGHAENIGFVLLIAIAAISHRSRGKYYVASATPFSSRIVAPPLAPRRPDLAPLPPTP